VKKMQAGEFKVRCLSVVDDVNATGGRSSLQNEECQFAETRLFQFLSGTGDRIRKINLHVHHLKKVTSGFGCGR
jgi:hypothetical protein